MKYSQHDTDHNYHDTQYQSLWYESHSGHRGVFTTGKGETFLLLFFLLVPFEMTSFIVTLTSATSYFKECIQWYFWVIPSSQWYFRTLLFTEEVITAIRSFCVVKHFLLGKILSASSHQMHRAVESSLLLSYYQRNSWFTCHMIWLPCEHYVKLYNFLLYCKFNTALSILPHFYTSGTIEPFYICWNINETHLICYTCT